MKVSEKNVLREIAGPVIMKWIGEQTFHLTNNFMSYSGRLKLLDAFVRSHSESVTEKAGLILRIDLQSLSVRI